MIRRANTCIARVTKPMLVAAAVHGAMDRHELLDMGIDPSAVLDFSSNQSPLDLPAEIRAAVARATLEAYPDRDARDFARLAAMRHGLDPRQVVVGNGSTEIIRLLAQLILGPGDVALSLSPSFGEYEAGTVLSRAKFEEHRLCRDENGFSYDHASFMEEIDRLRPRLCWLASPNNPTGVALPGRTVEELAFGFRETVFVLDEAYADLLGSPQWTASTLARGNLVVLRSMTKVWGLAGLRLGYALADESLAAPIRAAKPPWNVNACAQAAGEAALKVEAAYSEALALLRDGREFLTAGLRAARWKVLPSSAGFFLVEVGDAAQAKRTLLSHDCLVRDCTSFGLPEYVRVSPRLPEENRRLLEAFSALSLRHQVGGKE